VSLVAGGLSLAVVLLEAASAVDESAVPAVLVWSLDLFRVFGGVDAFWVVFEVDFFVTFLFAITQVWDVITSLLLAFFNFPWHKVEKKTW